MKKLYGLLICLCCHFLITAQNIDPKLAEAFQNTLDSMHQLLNIYGMSAAVQLPNDAIWAGGSGVSTLTPMDSVGAEHQFASGSTTKTITATCILQLVDEGILSLDDSLHLWVPEFENIDSNITIRQLLRHQSGISDVLQNQSFNSAMFLDPNQIWSLEEVVNTFTAAPAFPAGTNWAYCNTNYLLLGMIIEAATGNSFHQELQDRFFTPLGLESFSNPAYDPLPNPAAHLWTDLNGDGNLDDAFYWLTGLKSLFSAVAPAGGYFVKPADLAKWIKASMSGSLVMPDTWAEATETVNTSFPGNTRYGLGLNTRPYLGKLGYGHGGDLAGYSTQSYYFPEKDISIVVMSNDASINSWNLTSTLTALLQTYINCESIISGNNQPEISPVSFVAFPNPFSEKLIIELKWNTDIENVYFKMTNMLGQTVWTSDLFANPSGNEQMLSVETQDHLIPGCYILTAYSNEKILMTQKLFKR